MLSVAISKKIQERRNCIGWTKTELSRRTGLSPQFLCDIEAMRRMPSLPKLAILAEVLNFSIDEILANSEIESKRKGA